MYFVGHFPVGGPAGFVGSKRAAASGRNASGNEKEGAAPWISPGFRTKRSVWTIPVASEKESHFAVFPEKLIMPCILAGTSKRGCCPNCGAPLRRIVERTRKPTRPGNDSKVMDVYKRRKINQPGGPGVSAKTTLGSIVGNRDPERHVTSIKMVGWEPTCRCYNEGSAVPCTVLDPFAGSGTTLAAAVKKGRRAIGIGMNAEYVEILERKMRRAVSSQGFAL